MHSQIGQHELKAGWKQKRRGVGPGGGRRPAGRPPGDDDDDDGGATELDAGAEIDVGSGRPTGAQDVEESMYVCMYVLFRQAYLKMTNNANDYVS